MNDCVPLRTAAVPEILFAEIAAPEEISALTIAGAFKRLLNSPLRALAVKVFPSTHVVVLVTVIGLHSFLYFGGYDPTI